MPRSRSQSNGRSRRSRSRSRSPTHSNSRSRSRDEASMFALVKWLSGQHKDKFTSNVSTSWIRDFDASEPFQESYAIEWRVAPKPRNGWNIYDGVVIEVSDDVLYLKRKEAELMAAENTNRVSNPHTPHTPHRTPAQLANSPAVNNDLLQALLSALQPGAGPGQSNNAVASPSAGLTETDQVKIGKVLAVSKSCYLQAKVARSPTAMTMYLTRAAFSRKRLIRSSYAGQKRKMQDGTYVTKPSLKRYQAMKDIQDFVLSRFQGVSQSCFGAAVNSCTGEKARARPEIEYDAEVSCSDEED